MQFCGIRLYAWVSCSSYWRTYGVCSIDCWYSVSTCELFIARNIVRISGYHNWLAFSRCRYQKQGAAACLWTCTVCRAHSVGATMFRWPFDAALDAYFAVALSSSWDVSQSVCFGSVIIGMFPDHHDLCTHAIAMCSVCDDLFCLRLGNSFAVRSILLMRGFRERIERFCRKKLHEFSAPFAEPCDCLIKFIV